MWYNGEVRDVNFHILIYKFKKINKDRKKVKISYTGWGRDWDLLFDMDSVDV